MIVNPEWQKPKEKPYFHQTKLSSAHVSLDYIEKLVVCLKQFNEGVIDGDSFLELFKLKIYPVLGVLRFASLFG